MKRTKELVGTDLSFEIGYDAGGIGHYVTIAINGAFWDHREFGEDRAAAEAFFADPTAADRNQIARVEAADAARDAAMAPYRAMQYTRITTGRRVGAKPGAA